LEPNSGGLPAGLGAAFGAFGGAGIFFTGADAPMPPRAAIMSLKCGVLFAMTYDSTMRTAQHNLVSSPVRIVDLEVVAVHGWPFDGLQS
jgi:hypothetical protein